METLLSTFRQLDVFYETAGIHRHCSSHSAAVRVPDISAGMRAGEYEAAIAWLMEVIR